MSLSFDAKVKARAAVTPSPFSLIPPGAQTGTREPAYASDRVIEPIVAIGGSVLVREQQGLVEYKDLKLESLRWESPWSKYFSSPFSALIQGR